MLTANTDLEIRPSLAAEFDSALDHLTDAVLVKHGKRIGLKDLKIFILL